jgi:TolB-like protein/Tfp pilus assembly protein PilF
MRDVGIDLENLRSKQASARVTALGEELAAASVRAAATGQDVRRPSIFTSRLALVFYSLTAVLVVAAIVYMLLFRGASATKQPAIKSLAVLPLENLSGDPAQEYIADGMTEALITELSKISALRVISRTSVMQYKAVRKPLPEIARELSVDVIVAGSVQRSGEKIGITAQLIRAATDQHLWADQYERVLRDVLSLQREVARAIADEINVNLTRKEEGLLADARSVNSEALDAYLKGRDYFNQGRNLLPHQQGTDLLKTSIGYLEQATRIDPEFAMAYAGLARASHWLASGGSPEFYQRGKEAAERALEIDETLAEAHGALAFILQRFDWDWAGSEREYKRAIELDPNSEAHHGYALLLMNLGRPDQAIREIDLAQELDPLTLPLKYNVGSLYISARDYDRAIGHFRRLLDTQPNIPLIHANLGLAYMYKGMYAEGMAELRKASELSGDNVSRKALVAWGYAMSGNRSEAIKILDEILKSSGGPASKVSIARVYTALGDKDQAFIWLEKAYQERAEALLALKSNQAFDSLRSDPRYQDLLRRIGFPQ